MLLNCLLRNYLACADVALAQKLIAKAPFPVGASSGQLVRYLYYKGRVQAIQLDYSDAYASLMQAVRKAPPCALGFRTAATQLAIVVQLLMGEMPDRSSLLVGDMKEALAPYLAITAVVRSGDLRAFGAVVEAHKPALSAAGLLTLVLRLEGSVIRAGLRAVASAYARISLVDIARKLGLTAAEDAEALCAKVSPGVGGCFFCGCLPPHSPHPPPLPYRRSGTA